MYVGITMPRQKTAETSKLPTVAKVSTGTALWYTRILRHFCDIFIAFLYTCSAASTQATSLASVAAVSFTTETEEASDANVYSAESARDLASPLLINCSPQFSQQRLNVSQ